MWTPPRDFKKWSPNFSIIIGKLKMLETKFVDFAALACLAIKSGIQLSL